MAASLDAGSNGHLIVLSSLLASGQIYFRDMQASVSSYHEFFDSLRKINELVLSGADTGTIAEAYKNALAISKTAQEHHLAMVTRTERQMLLLREFFVLPDNYHNGFDSLPAEILLRIIKFVPRIQQPRFALLNRRLRDLVYSTPSLWTYISTEHMTETQIARHALMSQPLQLHVDAHACYSRLYFVKRDVLRLTASLDPRWCSISFDNYTMRQFQPPDETSIEPVSDLSSVRTLELPKYESYFFEEEEEDENENMEDFVMNNSRFLETFVSTWKFPRLSKLIIHENTPPPGSFTSIDTLIIELDQPSLCNEVKMRLFLLSLHHLQHLEIQMDCTGPFTWGNFRWKRHAITLGDLQSFQFSVKMRDHRLPKREGENIDYEELSMNFICSLSMPNVEKIDLGFFEDGPGLPNILFHTTAKRLFPPERSLDKVKSFVLRISPSGNATYHPLVVDAIQNFSKRFTSLETFTLHLPTETIDDDVLLTGPTPHRSSDFLRLQMAVRDYSTGTASRTWFEGESQRERLTGVRYLRSGNRSRILSDIKMPNIAYKLCPL